MKKVFLSFVLISCLFSLSAQSGEKFDGWKKADTEHFTFIYEDSSRETIEAYAEIADNAWNKIAQVYSIPKDHINIFVTDRTNTVNAFTYFSPIEIGMFTTPPTINDFGFRADWKELFFTHELIHAANASFEEKSTLPEKLIGPFAKNLDFMTVPGWALEGLTTVLETELTAGGRGRSPYFELEYKAPTLENSLISYSEIGLEQEPPRGQSYVLGYLIMRSIADRWGVQALADIERNRSFYNSWENSVKLVTGYTPEEIYRDAKIALVKKYAGERKIPEGITISPRNVNTNYYEPAFICDDGSLIALRTKADSSAAVVKLNPALKSGSTYLELTKPEEDLNTVFNETILVEGYFPESHSVTADENGVIYASMQNASYHKNPGTTVENAIYKWDEENGLLKLTEGASYIQPTVSRDGKILAALRQYGQTYAIVQIDTDSGKEKILLKDQKLNFIQPSLNSDGTEITFMAVDGKRAEICIMELSELSDISDSKEFQVVYNGDGEITDPSYPHFINDNGIEKLVVTDNKRGRLEAFEYDETEENFVPVVSDPCGVLWAGKTEKGIYYSTFSATGYVLKIKPVSEWGNVPDFDGPSTPGEIMTFGNLENDYPDFVPYEKLSEVEIPEKSEEEKAAEKNKLKEKLLKNTESETPAAIKGKVVKHRKEESVEKLNNLPEVQTQLSDEKKYIPLPEPLLYIPIVSYLSDSEINLYPGLGYSLVCLTPKLQMSYGACFANFNYYFGLNNFDFNLDYYAPLGTGTLQILLNRNLTNTEGYTEYGAGTKIKEFNYFDVGYKHPFYSVDDSRKSTTLSVFADGAFNAALVDIKPFAAFTKTDYILGLNGSIGAEYAGSQKQADKTKFCAAGLYGIGLYDFGLNKFFPGFEGEFSVKQTKNTLDISYFADVVLRYTDFPSDTVINGRTLAKFNGKILDCQYPGRGVFQVGVSLDNLFISGLDLRIYEETLCSFGTNTVDFDTPVSGNLMNFTFPHEYATGMELGLDVSGVKLAAGYSFSMDFKNLDEMFYEGNFYFFLKMDWFRVVF